MQNFLPFVLFAAFIMLAILLFGRKKPDRSGSRNNQRQSGSVTGTEASAIPVTSRVNNKKEEGIEEAAYIDQEDSTIGGDFYSEVASLLVNILKDDPARQDLRFKLLEVYYDSGRKQYFSNEMEKYRQQMGNREDKNWQRIVEMQSSLLQTAAEAKETGDVEDGRKFKRFGDTPRAKEPLEKLARQYLSLRSESYFYNKLDLELTRTADRPRRLVYAESLSRKVGGGRIYIKREDTSTRLPRLRVHLMGQTWIAKSLGREKLFYSTISGEEAVIAALAAARAELDCDIFIPGGNSRLRAAHKSQIEMLGSHIIEVSNAIDHTDLRNHMLETWLEDPNNSFMLLSLAAGPHPYPIISADLQGVIGRETIRQIKGKMGKLPSAIFSRGGKNNADPIGFVEPFLGIKETQICLVNPIEDKNKAVTKGQSPEDDLYVQFLTDEQKVSADFILNELEFPSVTRELATLKLTQRVDFTETSVADAKFWAKEIAQCEGLIIPLETAHVLAQTCSAAKTMTENQCVVMMLAEYLEKDLVTRSAADL